MFDIREYYGLEHPHRNAGHEIADIDEDVSNDINRLVLDRFSSLYRRDRYKHTGGVIEIIHPAIHYPGGHSVLLGPDRIRNLLSFYPHPEDLAQVDKIVVRPRYVEIGSIELVSLYLRKKKILVLYLCHPHFYRVRFHSAGEDQTAQRLEVIMNDRLTNDTVRREDEGGLSVHPLWYFLSLVRHSESDTVDKFFIKKEIASSRIYELLHDVSHYFSRHGY